MIRAFLATLILCAVSSCGMNPAFAKQQRHVQPICKETGSIINPVCGMVKDNNPFSGARSISVTMRKVGHLSAAGRTNKTGHKLVASRQFSAAAREPVQGVAAVAPSVGYSIDRPMRYIAGRLVCALNVNAALAERGIRGTGSALALSFRTWGHSAGGPVPGAVIISARRGGGHVAIVSRVENGVVYAWNATGGQSGWREIPYRHRVIDYRVPG